MSSCSSFKSPICVLRYMRLKRQERRRLSPKERHCRSNAVKAVKMQLGYNFKTQAQRRLRTERTAGVARDCSICSSVLETRHSSFFFSDHIAIHNQFPSNQELSFIARQPFSSPMRTSSRPWCRPVFTQLQRRGLEKRFQVTKYVTKRERLQIGAMLGLSETQVKVWFQNRRTKWRHEAAKKEEKEKEEARKKAKEEQCEEFVNLREEEKKDDDLLNVGAPGNKKPLSTLKKD